MSLKFSEERLSAKFHRWFFGINNIVPKSLKEAKIADSKHINVEEYQRLFHAFYTIDNKLYFGFSYAFLEKILKKQRYIEKIDKSELFKQTGYRRKINQLCCSMTFEQLIEVCFDLFKRRKLTCDFMTFLEFIENILREGEKAVTNYKSKEKDIYYRRKELMILRSPNLQQKKDLFFNLLDLTFNLPLENFETDYKNAGYSLSMKEKIFILKLKLGFVNQLLLANEKALEEGNTSRAYKKKKKINQLNVQKAELIKILEDSQKGYTFLFSKGIECYF